MHRLTLILALAVSVSCTVKEDREDCPSILVLDMGAVKGECTVSVRSEDGTFSLSGTVLGGTDELKVEVPAGRMIIDAVTGTTGHDDGAVTIKEGDECPPVCMFRDTVDIAGYETRVEVLPHKSYCIVNVRMTGDIPPDFVLRMSGNVCGLYAGGVPVSGTFTRMCVPDKYGRASVSVPRQKDSSLMIDVMSGSETRTFAIGNYMESAGYDWTSTDLDDMEVTINYTLTDMNITISKWTGIADNDVNI